MGRYEVLSPIRKDDGEVVTEGIIELEGADEKVFLERGFVRELPRSSSRKERKDATGGTANRQNSGGQNSGEAATDDPDVDSEMVRLFGEDLTNDLVRGGYKSAHEVRGAGEEELLAVNGIGKKSVERIRASLGEGGQPR